MKTIAVLSIGQTPRTDIIEDLRDKLPNGYRLTEYGLLDGMNRLEATRKLGYHGDEEKLVTRMGQDKQMIELSGDAVMEQMQACIDRAEKDGADLMLMACTGNFPSYVCHVPLLYPGVSQRKKAIEIAHGAEIGVIIPNAGQKEQIAHWWEDIGAHVTLLETADPFGAIDEIVNAGFRLKAAVAAVLCMDCFGYTGAQQAAVKGATGLETVLPREVLMEDAIRLLNKDL